MSRRDEAGYITYVGRTDDVFKASDYRISPFELESVLIEHEAVAEAAVVPSPDPVRLAVPKAYVALAAGVVPSAEVAQSIIAFSRDRLAPYKRLRRIEFAELPKTISGKIRRVELRLQEARRTAGGPPPAKEPGRHRRLLPVRPLAPRHHRVLGRGLQLVTSTTNVPRAVWPWYVTVAVMVAGPAATARRTEPRALTTSGRSLV